ncbi:hypothetical protein SAMN05428976_102269 [Clostridium sp. USBA 49]|jgi:hypothetical protein|uniref:putative DNA-binding protein n=1 Tax=Clostridium TaxID=1485 RepID=UPI0009998128|nr:MULTISPECIES: putative DNA-binding protein [Clostridium]SKA76362.1 hypothetical protein SAMN05428976_102269 [Clostridium sp. USBA 49]
MEERIEISILLDFYGELLTNKQRDIMSMYFNEDLSLAEIAEINGISRQAIHDIIKRCNKLLIDYEKKLQLKYANDKLNTYKKSLIKKLEFIKQNICNDEIIDYINELQKDIIENM